MSDPVSMRQLIVAVWFAAAVLGGSLIVYGSGILIPFAIAVMVWYVINALAVGVMSVRIFGGTAPWWLGLTVSLVCVFVFIGLVGSLMTASVGAVYEAAPTYARNIERLTERLAATVGMESWAGLGAAIRGIDPAPYVRWLASGLAGVAGQVGIVAVYVFFLLIEQRGFEEKLKALFPDAARHREVRDTLTATQTRIRTYIWIKTMMSLLTGGLSYVVLVLVGVDYAAFWGLLIFLLNYIPTLGSLLGIVFPTLLALVQFETLLPFVVVLLGCGVIQFAVGNVVEPRLMGDRLNVSPLVVILSLVVWGTIWGIPGMFLSVPMTVVMMIILSRFEGTRPLAVLLSRNGIPDDDIQVR